MKQKHKKDKKNKRSENEVREGRADKIHRPTTDSPTESYPLPTRQDEQYSNQSEFIDDEPNRKDREPK